MPLQQDVVESVANSNFKNIAEGPTQIHNAIMTEMVASQRNMNAIREKSISRSLERMDVMNADEGPNVIGTWGSVVAALQQIVKSAQSTPPVTP